MKTVFTTLTALTFIFLGTLPALAAAPNPADYAYQARLNAGPMQVSQVVKAQLSREILAQIDADFGNLQVLDNENAEVPFVLYDSPAAQVKEINRLQLSSANPETPAENLIDDNRLTPFLFDQKIDAQSPATITIDFGKTVDLHRLELWPTQNAHILAMELKHGLRADNLKTLRRKGEFKPLVDSTFPPLKWLEISLWGTKVNLEDFNAFASQKAEIYFTAEPQKRYRIVFGGAVDNKRYQQRVSAPERFDQSFTFTKPEFNPLAPDDIDEDGVLNSEDNCPLTTNKSQADDDTDRVGDACDNAKTVKNYNQADTDNDGVGDLIDNCKLEANPNQKDKDKDGFGDACDNAYAKESVFAASGHTAKGSTLPYGLLGGLLALLAVLGLGIYVGKKKQ